MFGHERVLRGTGKMAGFNSKISLPGPMHSQKHHSRDRRLDLGSGGGGERIFGSREWRAAKEA